MQEKQKIKQEIKKRKEKERKNFKKLLKQAKRWYKAQVLRAFICEVENSANDSGKMSDELKNWLCWAREKADWFDSILDKKYLILKDQQKEN